ncbi:MAG: exopolysaccharide biosynthesis polyprenyl glycosylphosphotransferase [Oscillatoriaceae bacterium SKW80]|nr:exopolysaccharide biosynthesis polyprenyl glycosylphosphotransferase [Oscillatoriaceae bacterium SKYG93]MCX8120121.1 exopolysaccharide biosynthesis polyprenyl glycosylphosphotransferase [Oscillatoriaceae bacterium SKW80]MDW8453047.1 exopolysaccharide biosynthesis polyprenyl glycosylphosphotransferase [Oscillatoriaceae cyanobacterium SKYGB_i_bin93]HIK29042.1 exopolysaccharide biosynthesis polyprenyl glycosylphosphotransferase [Oscillatoriaceae cyanobacterium M7585_C2015_266]
MVSQSPEPIFQVSISNQNAVVQLPPRLSVLEAVAFKQTCQQLYQENPAPNQIILDFSQTTFIDSSGVGALVNNVKTAQQQGVKLILRGVQPQVMAVLSLTGLDQVLTIEPTVETKQFSKTRKVEENLPTTHPSVRSWVKRAIDIVGALVGLAITAVLLIPIAIAVKLDSPGPVFFGQIRCGWMGKRFKLWKIRSMYVNAEAMKSQVPNQIEGPLFKNENDPRITRVGRFLRRTSLDELPQFWNVLKGEMSLVGTRPPLPEEVERYDVPEWQRLDVKPGMTGEWQVNGRSSIRSFEDVIRLDLKYQKNWSLMYDLKLIIKTILILFSKNSGAM